MNKNLTTEQKNILFEEGTEAPGSSPLNSEKREGYYCCVVCGTKLFESTSKYESGSGWPSFFKYSSTSLLGNCLIILFFFWYEY